MKPHGCRRAWTVGVATTLVSVLLAPGLGAPRPAAAGGTTSRLERSRVDSVPAPRPDWYDCDLAPDVQCASVRLPLDYDRPTGATVEISMARRRATDPRRRIGTLFVNPGGPGASAADFVSVASTVLSPDLLARFDVVGIDPRGSGYSENVRCFTGVEEQSRVLGRLPDVAFPYTRRQDRAWVRGLKTFSRACATTGRPLTGAMSTAQAARDLDVLRRSLGEDRLTFLGFSYGSYLGEVYGNLFPDRVRALALDGVIDPLAWAGTARTRRTAPQDRLRAAEAGYRALREVLRRCEEVGERRCSFARGDPSTNFQRITKRLKRAAVTIDDPFSGDPVTFGYSELISYTYHALYDPFGYAYIADTLAALAVLTDRSGPGSAGPVRAGAQRRLSAQLAKVPRSRRVLGSALSFPYANRMDAYYSVLCTDSRNPASAHGWLRRVRAAERRVPHYGRMLSAQSVPCATNVWTVRDEDAYRGPFTATTAAPVLVVGNTWDPITRIEGAVRVARLLPNARLLRSRSWGHTAYGSSRCVTDAMDRYLLAGELPRAGAECVGDVQPFPVSDDEDEPTGRTALVVAEQELSRRGERSFTRR